jgi:hypothetical protein
MPVARFHPFTATAAQDLGERGAWYTVKQLQPRGQRIEVLTIDSNISTGSFRNATDDSLTYQIKGQEKTVARGDSPPGPAERFGNSKKGGCFGRPFWAGPRRPLDWP